MSSVHFSPVSKSFSVKICFNEKSKMDETNFNWMSGTEVELIKVPKKALKKRAQNTAAVEDLSKYTKVCTMYS